MALSSLNLEKKVIAGGLGTALTGAVAWALVTFVPLFHSGLPVALSNLLPYLVALVLGFIAAYRAPHTPRPPASIKITADPPQDAHVAG